MSSSVCLVHLFPTFVIAAYGFAQEFRRLPESSRYPLDVLLFVIVSKPKSANGLPRFTFRASAKSLPRPLPPFP
jgi:hypothetical protein